MADEEPTPDKPQQGRSGPTQMQQRITRALEVVLQGGSTYDLAAVSLAEGWGVTERQLQTYMARARETMADANPHRLDRLELITEHVAIRKRLYAMCLTNGEFAVGLNTLKDIAEILGIYAPKKDERTLKIEGGTLAEKTDAELGEILDGGD